MPLLQQLTPWSNGQIEVRFNRLKAINAKCMAVLDPVCCEHASCPTT